MKRLAYGIVGICLTCLSAFFVAVSAYVVSTDLLPAVEAGSLNVRGSTMILNILWEGNEIYVVLAAYCLLAAGFAYGAIRALGRAIRK